MELEQDFPLVPISEAREAGARGTLQATYARAPHLVLPVVTVGLREDSTGSS